MEGWLSLEWNIIPGSVVGIGLARARPFSYWAELYDGNLPMILWECQAGRKDEWSGWD